MDSPLAHSIAKRKLEWVVVAESGTGTVQLWNASYAGCRPEIVRTQYIVRPLNRDVRPYIAPRCRRRVSA